MLARKIFIGVISFIAIFIIGIKIIGIDTYVVASDSMSPAILKNSVVYVKGVKQEDLREGDIIAFDTGDEKPVMHRIVEINDLEIITKGDGNDANDNPIRYNNVIGKVIFHIPVIGLLFYNIYFWLIILSLILIYYLSKMFIKELKKSKEQ